jgi:spore maturation protein CgeB
MKLLIIGGDSDYSIERFYLKYCKEHDSKLEIEFFAAQKMFYDNYNKNIFNKIIFKLGLSLIYKIINEKLKKLISKFKPDVIFIFKGMEIFPSTLLMAKKLKIILINYNPDNPFIFSGSGSGNNNITNSIVLYNIHFTYNLEVKKQIQQKFNIPTHILPFGFDIDSDTFKYCETIDEVNKVCFIGNPDKYRVKFILQLAMQGICIDLYGHDWDGLVKNKNVTCYKAVYGIEFWILLRKYRVQLNLMRPHNLSSHNMRSFEIPGIGGIQLAPFTKDHDKYFKDGSEIFLFKNLTECLTKINFLLSLTKDTANIIRFNSRANVLNNKHSYSDRSLQFLEILKSL